MHLKDIVQSSSYNKMWKKSTISCIDFTDETLELISVLKKNWLASEVPTTCNTSGSLIYSIDSTNIHCGQGASLGTADQSQEWFVPTGKKC